MQAVRAWRIGWLVDGTGHPPVRDITILAIRGIIEKVVPYASACDLPSAPEDLTDCTVVPGLIDTHVHLCLPVGVYLKTNLDPGEIFGSQCRDITRRCRMLLENGVVAVRDGGDANSFMPRYKKEFDPDAKQPLALQVAEAAWHQNRRYGRLIGRTPPPSTGLAGAVAQTPAKVDHIKIINSGLNSLTCFGQETPAQFAAGELAEALKIAKAHGLKAMVHANGTIPVGGALAAECDSIEHGYFMGPENLKQMAAKGIYWVPTAGAMAALERYFKPQSLEAQTARRNLDHQFQQMAAARSLGVKIALGTDAGGVGLAHGLSLHQEMGLLMAAGYRLEEAIKCTTANGADLLGLTHLGRLIPGKAATFVVFRGAPENLPGHTEQIGALYINGQKWSSD